jgi:hypothetical protein
MSGCSSAHPVVYLSVGRVVAITGAIVRAASVPGFGDWSVLAEVYRP